MASNEVINPELEKDVDLFIPEKTEKMQLRV